VFPKSLFFLFILVEGIWILLLCGLVFFTLCSLFLFVSCRGVTRIQSAGQRRNPNSTDESPLHQKDSLLSSRWRYTFTYDNACVLYTVVHKPYQKFINRSGHMLPVTASLPRCHLATPLTMKWKWRDHVRCLWNIRLIFFMRYNTFGIKHFAKKIMKNLIIDVTSRNSRLLI